MADVRALSGAVLAALLAAGAPAPATAQFQEDGLTVLGGLSLNARSGSFGDFDGDGDPDLLIQGDFGVANERRLLRNNIIGAGTADFSDASALLDSADGNTNNGWSAAWGDYDGDGDVDVFLGMQNDPVGASGDLLRNDGGVGFTDVSASSVDDPEWHQNVAWADIDGDGDLDLLIAMEVTPYEIYRQNADGSFTAIGAQTHFATSTSHGYGMAIGDTDGDGDLDVYISTCFQNNLRNTFFENQLADSGVLDFVDVTATTGTQYLPNSYGAEFHDYDDDGDLDLFMVGASGNDSVLWRNDGPGAWTDVDTILGMPLLSSNGVNYNGARSIDYDNDGDLDLFLHDRSSARALFRNDGGWSFTDVTVAAGLDNADIGGYDSAWADYDLDGDLDLYAATLTAQRFFVSDVSTNGNHWLQVRLVGPPPNTTAIGARLYATIHVGTASERTLRRDANANAGTFHQSDLPVHFGLGAATLVDRLVVVWPGGATQELEDVAVDQFLTLSPAPVPALPLPGLALLAGALLAAARGGTEGRRGRGRC